MILEYENILSNCINCKTYKTVIFNVEFNIYITPFQNFVCQRMIRVDDGITEKNIICYFIKHNI